MISVLTEDELVQGIKSKSGLARPYFAMYSSLWDGIVRDPRWMLIPIDDHMVHRGDGVFEAVKFLKQKPYMLAEHLERLLASAASIGLVPFAEPKVLTEIVLATVQASGQQEGLLRIFMSRGPGSFSVNPYDTAGTQFFVVVTALTPPPAKKFEEGAVIGRSQVAVKESWMARVKSCNYLPNVMMKKEAVDRSLDFVVSFDDEGFLAESATENIVLVSAAGVLVKPGLSNILRGTTMTRVFDLASRLCVSQGGAQLLQGIESRNISESEIRTAKEVMMLGTTLDVLPVTQFEGKPISDGRVGPVARALLQALKEDQNTD